MDADDKKVRDYTIWRLVLFFAITLLCALAIIVIFIPQGNVKQETQSNIEQEVTKDKSSNIEKLDNGISEILTVLDKSEIRLVYKERDLNVLEDELNRIGIPDTTEITYVEKEDGILFCIINYKVSNSFYGKTTNFSTNKFIEFIR